MKILFLANILTRNAKFICFFLIIFYNNVFLYFFVSFLKILVNGLGAPGVLPPFALGIGTPLAGGYSSGIPNLGAFALANSGALQTTAPALRGFSNVLLVSNLNEEVSMI